MLQALRWGAWVLVGALVIGLLFGVLFFAALFMAGFLAVAGTLVLVYVLWVRLVRAFKAAARCQ